MVAESETLVTTVQGLKYAPMASIICCRFPELIGCVFVTFSEAPGSNVADSLDGAYLGPFCCWNV